MDKFYCGKRGSGKTLRAVIDIWMNWFDGYEIYTNTLLHKAFDTNYITKQKGNLHLVDAIDLIKLMLADKIPDTSTPKILLLDEIKTQASSRGFSTYVNRYLSDFISQARKRKFTVIYTDQILIGYDKWMRQMTDKLIMCNGIVDYNDLGLGTKDYPEPIVFEYAELEMNELSFERPIIYDIPRNTARRFYPLFDTGKMIKPLTRQDDRVKEIEGIA